MNVYLDLDGVLYNWNKAAARLAGVNYNDPHVRQDWKRDYDYLEKKVGKDVLNPLIISAGGTFWEDIELLPWAKDLYKQICNSVGEKNVYFCTAYGTFLDGATAKAKVLKRDFDTTDRVILTHEKHLLANPNSLLIDDKPSNLNKFTAYGGCAWEWPSAFKFLDDELLIHDEMVGLLNYLEELQRPKFK
jgi:5'(3')-deoxyribonucleotidase